MSTSFKPHIGKNVIETLTLGMYEDSRFIFREYIQNSADQIDIAVEQSILSNKDEGRISVRIDPKKKHIQVTDNATGIGKDSVLPFLGDIANSTKDENLRKGFRGIGRLGGLGYCERLIFETSFQGESVKSIITLDAKQLRKLITDINVRMDASEVISVILTVATLKENRDEHYFKVILENVTNDELLNTDSVREYLSMVAPVPFKKSFKFAERIRKHFEENNFSLDEYTVMLGDEQIRKGYKNAILDKNGVPESKILDVGFFDIRNAKKTIVALGWYGISNSLNTKMTASNIDRGLRIRKNNIGIGSEDTLNRFFKEHRYNQHYIGEIHVFGPDFRPNARRDYFNDNFTVKIFEEGLRTKVNQLYLLAHESSRMNNRNKEILAYEEAARQFNESKKAVRDSGESARISTADLISAKAKAEQAKKTLEGLRTKSKDDPIIKTLYSNIVGDPDREISVAPVEPGVKVKKRDPFRFPNLTDNERKLVFEIFSVIDTQLSKDQAEELKLKIVERLG